MSAPLFPGDILFMQRLLRAEGLYRGPLNGKWGPATDKAVAKFEMRAMETRDTTRRFDERSERNILSLALRAQREARLFLGRVQDAGLIAKIISGTRTYAEQDALYAQGRFGSAGKIVTKAKGGESNHNFGIAWDVALFDRSGAYLQGGSAYDQAAKAGLSAELEWGGHWKGFVDKPHYQLRLPMELAQLRGQFEAGKAAGVYA
jgi:peptidoglycan L-alanyl-D-glutamate endopeptidase CwlK